MKSMHAIFLAGLLACSVATAEETAKFGRFGEVVIYGDAKTANKVVLFVSGDGGWNEGVVDMARDFSGNGALVVGIDIRRYLAALAKTRDKCAYPAADFEALSQAMQKKLSFERYITPLLAGYSSGATLVYATLAQSPPNTFGGAISLGFCPDLAFSQPLCAGSGLKSTPSTDARAQELAAGPLPARWAVLQGGQDQVCKLADVAAFTAQIPQATLFELPKVGHGFSKAENWLPQLRTALDGLVASTPTAAQPAAIGDLPLVEVPSNAAGDTLAVIVSGDGGWAGIDKSLGEAFAADGIAVVGLNSLQYFWKKRDPDETSRDLERVLRHYGPAWNRSKFLLVGYSTGADVMPFMVSRLPADLRARVKLVALLSPNSHASFEFRVGQWIGAAADDALPVKPEIAKLTGTRVLCIHGDRETDTLCDELGPAMAASQTRKGGHHYDGDFRALAADILKAAH